MASYDELGYDQWPILFLYYKLDIFQLFRKAHTVTMASLNCYPKTFVIPNVAATISRDGEKTAYLYLDLILDI